MFKKFLIAAAFVLTASLSYATEPSFTTGWTAGKPITVQGIYTDVPTDSGSGCALDADRQDRLACTDPDFSTEYVVKASTKAGTQYSLRFRNGTPNVLRGASVRLTGKLYKGKVYIDCCGLKDKAGTLSTTEQSNFTTTNLTIVPPASYRLAVFILAFTDTTPVSQEFMNNASQTIANINANYREFSYNNFGVTGDLLGPYTLSGFDPLVQTSRSAVATAAKAAAVMDGKNMSDYDKFLYISPTRLGVTAGWGDLSGAWLAECQGQTCFPGSGAIIHELGHHFFGLVHAHGLVCDDGTPLGTAGSRHHPTTCTMWDYGDDLDSMGVTSNGNHFNSITKRDLGWLGTTGLNRIQDVTADGDYTIYPFETVGTGQLKAITVPGGVNKTLFTFYLEYRQPIGYDSLFFPAGTQPYHGITFHIRFNDSELLEMEPRDPTNSYYQYLSTIIDPALQVGHSYCNPVTKYRFTVLSADTTKAVVRVKGRQRC